jgi:hypothetical protein
MKSHLKQWAYVLLFWLLCFDASGFPQVCATTVVAGSGNKAQNPTTFSYDSVLNPAHGYDRTLIPIPFEENSPRKKLPYLFAVFGEFLATEGEAPLVQQLEQQQMTGPSTLTTGLGNISGGTTTAENALTQAEQWLGPGYQEIAPGVFRSADDTLQFRMTTSDLTDPIQGPHVHFEAIGPDGGTIIENSHVGISNP